MRMWAIVNTGQPLQAIEKENPEPKGSEVLLEVSHCAICHSNLHFWKGEYDLGYGNIALVSNITPGFWKHSRGRYLTAGGKDAIS